jgi:hypothetical protein
VIRDGEIVNFLQIVSNCPITSPQKIYNVYIEKWRTYFNILIQDQGPHICYQVDDFLTKMKG